MNGTVGLNILGDRAFDSAVLISYVQQLHPAFCVVLNSTDLAMKLLPHTRVICRFTPDDGIPSTGAAFVQARRASVPEGAYLYIPNEPNASADLNQFILDAQAEAGSSLKLCIGNFGTGNPESSDFDTLVSSINNAIARRDYVDVHEYFYQTGARDYPYQVGRVLAFQQRFPNARFIVTEHGALNLNAQGTFDDKAGWRTYLSEQAYTDAISANVVSVYAPHNIAICIYCWPEWDGHGFDISAAASVLQPKFVELNTIYEWKDYRVTTFVQKQIKATADPSGANVRPQAAATGTPLRVVHAGDTIQCDPTPHAGGSYSVGGTTRSDWYTLDNGYLAASVVTLVDPPPTAETNVVLISSPYVPYFSEFNWMSDYTALCGQTSLYMLLCRDRMLKAVTLPREITPYTIAQYLGKGAKDGSTLLELQKAGLAYGLATQVMTRTMDQAAALIADNVPLIVLIDYSKLPTRSDQQYSGLHILVIVGVSDQSMIVNDPDNANGVSGNYLHYPKADFAAAWASAGNTALVLT